MKLAFPGRKARLREEILPVPQIPGMSHVLRHIGRINRIYLGKITVEDGATGYVKAGGILDASLGIIAIREEIPQSLATREPVAIKAGDGQHIRNIDLVTEGLPFTPLQ